MTKLSVNINKIATLRNARGENNPDVLKMALLIEDCGADGITVHPRPDERHIKRSDVFRLKQHLRTEFNVEGYPSADFIAFMQEIRPHQITLVPDLPSALTSNAGFKLKDDFGFLQDAIKKLEPCASCISIFIDPMDFLNRDVAPIKNTGADRIELYTKAYADFPTCQETLGRYVDLAKRVSDLGMGVNAGHDLSLENLAPLLKAIPNIAEVSIGHALICDALVFGLKETVGRYLSLAHGI
ncbi:MAG TPA: pyridoxine 5'-phosphate synthase [Myxococcota bacterium]|nr:pyridoxine 5'-phosphate synthase [Myxococcota bacterium]